MKLEILTSTWTGRYVNLKNLALRGRIGASNGTKKHTFKYCCNTTVQVHNSSDKSTDLHSPARNTCQAPERGRAGGSPQDATTCWSRERHVTHIPVMSLKAGSSRNLLAEECNFGHCRI
jgi:hypothetical protein